MLFGIYKYAALVTESREIIICSFSIDYHCG